MKFERASLRARRNDIHNPPWVVIFDTKYSRINEGNAQVDAVQCPADNCPNDPWSKLITDDTKMLKMIFGVNITFSLSHSCGWLYSN